MTANQHSPSDCIFINIFLIIPLKSPFENSELVFAKALFWKRRLWLGGAVCQDSMRWRCLSLPVPGSGCQNACVCVNTGMYV